MNRTSLKRALTAGVVALAALPLPAQAHRAWMLPSATVLSGNDNSLPPPVWSTRRRSSRGTPRFHRRLKASL